MRPWPLDRATIREGAASDPAKPGNQPWTNVKPRGAARARGPFPQSQGLAVGSFPSPQTARGVAAGENAMCVTRIIDGLEMSEATGREADVAARMGLLEWIFDEAGSVGADAARAALQSPAAQNPVSPAARAFVGFLTDASRAMNGGAGGRRRARGRLN